MADLLVTALSAWAGKQLLVDRVGFAVAPGEIVGIIGANGAGKSSLLRAMMGLIADTTGCAEIDGADIAQMRPAARARTIAWLPQAVPLAWPVLVRDAIALGRFAHGAIPSRPDPVDAAAINRAIAFCGIAHLAERSTAHLSGGELARVHLARALASESPWLLADEPVAALDPRHRIAIMQRLRAHAKRVDATGGTLIILHDLELAARFCDRLLVMHDGALIADGTPADVLTPPLLARAFGVEARIDKLEGWPRVTIMAGETPPA